VVDIKWVVYDIFGKDFDRAIEIDKEIIKLHFIKGARVAYDEIIEKFEDEERTYALIRWAFLTGVKMALKFYKQYEHLIYLLNALIKLGADDALTKFLKAEFEGNYDIIKEIEEVII